MLQTKPTRLEIALSLSNPFDYVEFSEACQRQEIEPLSIGEYSQKIGMVKTAQVKFPEMAPEQAYLEFIDLMNQAVGVKNKPPEGSCGGCGGGQTL